MNREEKKKWLEEHKNMIVMNFDCGGIGIGCGNCPFVDTKCGTDKEVHDLLEEVWAEAHGYVKKEKVKLEKITIDPSKIGPTITVKNATDKQLNPDHYKTGKLQTIEQMMIVFSPNKVANFCEVNAFKYHARAGLKGDASLDHKKADWYMRLYDLLKVFGCMDGEKALEVLREFLKEEEEK
ncbi:DUF3310 domain-containing protein [Erysipelotrichaceae bacterium 66-17]